MTRRILHLNAFENCSPVNISSGLWRAPEDQGARYKDIDYWTDLAKLLEDASFDAVFLSDVLGIFDLYRGGIDATLRDAIQVPINDPFSVVPAMAAATRHLGFAVTASITYEHPYSFARKMTSLDHLTKGRIGWNIVTSYLESAARNLGLSQQMSHDERYDRGDEFMQVAYKLWQGSWEDDAVVIDRARGVYVDPAKVHPIRHEGRWFSVPDPFLCEPSIQRTPVLFQAGSSARGQRFAATHAEGVFVHGTRPEVIAPVVRALRAEAAKMGRDPRALKVLAVCTIVAAETDAAARDQMAHLQSFASYEGAMAQFSGPLGLDVSKYDPDKPLRDMNPDAAHFTARLFADADPDRVWTLRQVAEYMGVGGMGPTFVGSGASVADEMERWADVADLDGFNIAYAVRPDTFRDVARFVVPELKNRRAMRDGYPGTTFRESLAGPGRLRLADDHPGRRYDRL